MPAHSYAPAALSVVMLVVLSLAVWFDVRERRIPNTITALGVVAALVVRASMGSAALLAGAVGVGAGLLLGLLFFSAGAMGAGDGKLLATVGGILGFEAFLWCLPLIGGFGGVLVLVMTVRNGTILPTLARFRALLFHLVTFGRIGARGTLTAPGAATVPYGVAIAAGAATAWLGWGMTP